MKLSKYVIFRQELEQNNTSKQKVGHCDKTTLQICFISIILNTYVPCQNSAKIFSGSGEEVDFFYFAIFSNGGHLGYST